MKKIIDVFTFFGPTGKELLELRVNMLKDYVDKFVICESNKTQSGIPIQFELRDTIKKLGLPEDRIIVIELQIPDDDVLEILDIDKANCYHGNDKNITSVRARARERLQKDAIQTVLNKFSDDSLFIVSDSDEIINPLHIDWFSNIVLRNPENLVKIPLVHLEGRADLRVFHTYTNTPKLWDGGMFMCTKYHLKIATPTQLRSNVGNPFPISYIHENGIRVEDAGWHFSWMGNASIRKHKRESFCHYSDTFDFVVGGKYDSQDMIDLLDNEPIAGNISVSGEIGTVLRHYPTDRLPSEIFKLQRVYDFLLPQVNTNADFFKNEFTNACQTVNDINEHLPLLNELASECSHVTEMGVRTGCSTRAFLYADVILRSYDLELDQSVSKLFEVATSYGKDATYTGADVRQLTIEETDLLFIDTWHCYEQLKIELNRHHSKARKYIAMHDTYTFGVQGEHTEIGLLPALIEFIIEHPEWRFKIHRINNNGLTVIERYG